MISRGTLSLLIPSQPDAAPTNDMSEEEDQLDHIGYLMMERGMEGCFTDYQLVLEKEIVDDRARLHVVASFPRSHIPAVCDRYDEDWWARREKRAAPARPETKGIEDD